ncbi:MAG TPA: C45 family autoproteolytic acyltransferase/hydrolase [Desulfobacterales bacterium]|nr:C45 family autoproteolytic acyltransferase/hydrolase [Desulfobacterales bacterium]
MIRRRPLRLAWLAALWWIISLQPSHACTLWGAAGNAVEGGGVLITKNRDWIPDHRQQLDIVRPKDGYASVVLAAVGGAEPGAKAGVNEKGLVIVTATVSQVLAAERKRAGQMKGLMSHLLARCASVEDVLKQIELFHRPVFYLVGDRRQIAVIEVAPDGSRSIARTDSGTLHHTNHYCAIDTPDLKRKPGASSTKRSARIEELLKNPGRPYTVDDFIRFSEDKTAGADNSIWRTGSAPQKTRTLATWLVSIPASGSPRLYLKTADPGEAERRCRLAIDDALRITDRDSIPLDSDLCKGPAILIN